MASPPGLTFILAWAVVPTLRHATNMQDMVEILTSEPQIPVWESTRPLFLFVLDGRRAVLCCAMLWSRLYMDDSMVRLHNQK